MMFPVRNDATVECNGGKCWTSNTITCKIVRFAAFVVALLFLLLLLGIMTHGPHADRLKEPLPPPSPPSPHPPLTSSCTVEIGEKMKQEIKSWIQQEIEKSSKNWSKQGKMNPEQMRNMVKEEIKRQQKTQLKPDFASASAGGMVLDASPTWTEGYSYIYFLFIPIRSTAPPPSIVLEPTRQAGDCWPMKGQQGDLLIQLAARANIVGFTMEHIDAAMSLSGGTPEAPKNFTVYGIENPDHPDRRLSFGTFRYDNKNDEEIQYFRVQNIHRKSFLYVLLEISSNHGNEKYTCLYRFQVHGFIDRAHHCSQ